MFCHNDFQEGNILYMADSLHLQRGMPEGQADPLQDVVRPIDFEYSSYNYRGFDIGNHFCEWCYNYNVDTEPYFSANLDHFPNMQQQLNFIREYLKESKLSLDEEDSLVVEANAFALASHFMWCLWSIVQSKKSQIVFGYLVRIFMIISFSLRVDVPKCASNNIIFYALDSNASFYV